MGTLMQHISYPDGYMAVIFRSPDDLAEVAAILADKRAVALQAERNMTEPAEE